MIISFTGHRSKFFPGKYDETHEWIVSIRENLRQKLDIVRPDWIISGMALGWDMIAAEVGIELGIPVHCYIPFREQGSKWPPKSLERYNGIIDAADCLFICSKEYHPGAFHKRDELMVRNSDIVYALWNPVVNTGGTYHTVKYAEKQDRTIVNFWRDYE